MPCPAPSREKEQGDRTGRGERFTYSFIRMRGHSEWRAAVLVSFNRLRFTILVKIRRFCKETGDFVKAPNRAETLVIQRVSVFGSPIIYEFTLLLIFSL